MNGNNKYNKYDLSGCFGIGYASNNDDLFYFDLEDYNKIKNTCWYSKNGRMINKTAVLGYIVIICLVVFFVSAIFMRERGDYITRHKCWDHGYPRWAYNAVDGGRCMKIVNQTETIVFVDSLK